MKILDKLSAFLYFWLFCVPLCGIVLVTVETIFFIYNLSKFILKWTNYRTYRRLFRHKF